jgi:hypothetical protein
MEWTPTNGPESSDAELVANVLSLTLPNKMSKKIKNNFAKYEMKLNSFLFIYLVVTAKW